MLSLVEISPLQQADWSGRADRWSGALSHPTSTHVQVLSPDSEIVGGRRQ